MMKDKKPKTEKKAETSQSKKPKISWLKRVSTAVYWLLISFMLLVAGAVFLSTFNTPLQFRLFSVQSGSMEPTVHLGSLVIVRTADSYQQGEIVTFRQEGKTKNTVTHRIVEVQEDQDLGRVSYRTKGDANEDPDSELVSSRRVIGRVAYTIPLLGYVVGFAQTQQGLVTLVIVPAAIIIYSELMNIKKRVIHLVKKRQAAKTKSKKNSNQTKPDQ